MTTLKFEDTHNMVEFRSKSTESGGFEQIVDILNTHPIRYALTVNPTIYISCIEQFWSIAKAKTINGELQLHARVNGKEIVIIESYVKRDLKIADQKCIDCLPNSTIFEQLALMGVLVLGAKKQWGILPFKLERRIDAIDADEDITLVNDADNEMFDMDDLGGEEVFIKGQNDNVVEKINADHQLAERLQAQEQEELSDAEKATLFQQVLEKRRKYFAAKRAEEIINKPPTKAQQRKIMCTYLKNMEGYKLKDLKLKEFDRISRDVEDDKEKAKLKELMETIPDEEVAIDAIPLAVKEDLEALYRLVKARYGSTRPMENIDYLLWSDMEIMFEPHVEDEVWKLQKGHKVLEWKLYESYEVHSLMMQSMQIYILVEKKYPLTPHTLSMMLEKKLQIDYESKMAY
nr:hypothetical protein [Tanacetum cinerariifolium]